jgi:hypothetical protein
VTEIVRCVQTADHGIQLGSVFSLRDVPGIHFITKIRVLETAKMRNLTRQCTQYVDISSENLQRFLCQFSHFAERAMRFLNQSEAGQSFASSGQAKRREASGSIKHKCCDIAE